MPGKYCCVCGNNLSKDPHVSFHRFPSDIDRLATWLQIFKMTKEEVKSHMRVCSRHFPDGDASKTPSPTVGKRFSSPLKKGPRSKRAKTREVNKQLTNLLSSPSLSPRSSRSASPAVTPGQQHNVLMTPVGEQLQNEYVVHELPSDSATPGPSQTDVLVNTALLSRIEILEAENACLKKQKPSTPVHFKIEHIQHDDRLVRFYTGFVSYAVFISKSSRRFIVFLAGFK